MNKTLRLVLVIALAAAMVPVPALGEEAEAEYDRGTGQQASSWRFVDGVLAEPVSSAEAPEGEDGPDGGIAPLAAWEDVPVDGASVANTWTCANTKDNYTLRFKPTDEDTIVSVPGTLAVGIDVSEHNNDPGGRAAGPIDWNQVKADGVTFAIIRCGYGSDYADQDDDWFASNYEGARAAGLDVGVYLYSYAPKAAGAAPSAQSEAQHVLRVLRENDIEPADLAYPVYLDLEDFSQTTLKRGVLGDIATTFCSTIAAAGYSVGIYANQYWFDSVLKDDHAVFDPDTMAANGWSRWVARYSNGTSSSEVANTDIWQFTPIGKVNGTPKTYCDVNFAYREASATAVRPTSYQVVYKLNGGKNHASNTATYTGTLVLKNPTRSGYTFKGWYADRKFKKKVTKLTNKSATLYAKWAKNYKITYKLNGGKNSKSNPKKASGTVKLKSPTRSGYVFKGWYTNKRLTKRVTKLSMTKNRTVYAKWQKLRPGTYKVTAKSGLNLRKSASTSSRVLKTLRYAKKVRITKIRGGWGYVRGGGWVNLAYAKRV